MPPDGESRPQADRLLRAAQDLLAFSGVRPFSERRERRDRAANARVVAITGLALLLLLPVPYATALSLDALWRVHYFSGLLLVPLLGVKLAATGWRALRYYMGDRGFRADGPPHPMARLSAPILVAATVVLFVSGVAMLLGADRFGAWSTIHNGSAVVFTGALGLHLLAHLWDSPAEVLADVVVSRTRPASRVPGARGRLGLTVVAFIIGITVATAAMPVSHWQAAPTGAQHRDG
jgi:hypothetical protein